MQIQMIYQIINQRTDFGTDNHPLYFHPDKYRLGQNSRTLQEHLREIETGGLMTVQVLISIRCGLLKVH